MTRVIAVANHKGGVGKTTIVRELALALRRRGKRVLMVDMDNQGNLSRRSGYILRKIMQEKLPTLVEALRSPEPGLAADIVVPAIWDGAAFEGIDLLPARFDLEQRETEAGSVVGAVKRLATILAGFDDDYDYVLIDCKPSLGHLVQMAFYAAGKTRADGSAGFVLLVTELEWDAMEAAQRTMDFIAQNKDLLDVPQLRVGGVIVNRVREGVGLHGDNNGDLHEFFGDLVWQPHLPLWTVMGTAHNDAVPLPRTGRGGQMLEKVDALAAHVEELG